jgi:phospholipase D1/2
LINCAKDNTKIYREVFGCYPDNKAKKFGDIEELKKKANPSLYKEKIKKLKGHYVQWPVNFL